MMTVQKEVASACVLNVDDNAASLYAKSRILRRAGFAVIEASTGLQALELVRSQSPDIVLLDVHLPDVSGLDVCTRIKADAQTASTIVLQVSASFTDRDDRIRGLDGGADSYLTEPIEPEELIANVRALLRLRRAEEELRRAGVEWQATFAATRDGLAIVDQAGRIVRCNAAFETLVGAGAGSSLAEPFQELSEEDLFGVMTRARQSAGTACVVRAGERWIRFSFDPIPNGSAASKFVCGAADITAEHKLREAHERISTVLGSITEGQYVLDRNWRFVSVNRVSEQYFGRPAEQLIGSTIWDEFPEAAGGEFHRQYEEALRSRTPIHFEAESPITGTWLEAHAYPRGENLEVYVHDISVRKALEQQLRAAIEEAEAANRAKDEFLATVSHELRTPVTAMLGWGQMLQAYITEDEAVRSAATAIVQAARIQTTLIDDMLDMSRIVTGKLRLNLVPCDFADAVQEAIASVVPAMQAKGIALQAEISPAHVVGDQGRLQQVAWNLLSNAVKFTPASGRVTVSLASEGSRAVLRVSDTGAGVDSRFLPRVFERFSQGEPSASSQGGLGLGLSIVKHITELHGGDVEAWSEGVGRGATFSVFLPLHRPADA